MVARAVVLVIARTVSHMSNCPMIGSKWGSSSMLAGDMIGMRPGACTL